ncbi:PGAP1-like protein [Hymenobacter daecheongensis DSM 21074]|uniref:PGAP1-like protein n=1 Tax=Hymenobacter daecheongensis DSM 21074 TaxID=1121955 RepID=A0A1M6LPS4_9BACT|nr:alpha/beta fold hydrolase [Hymenobacter daecheongensis]SHJ73170.1 PGAP1-like protein [Hymenobacter daecheongensis DSM 21074]
MTDSDSPAEEPTNNERPSRWRRFSTAARRAASFPLAGFDYLYRTGQAYGHFTLPILNGAFGDQLAARHDERAIWFSFRRYGTDVAVPDLHLPAAPAKTVVFLHGLMGDEMIWQSGSPDTPRYGPLLQQEAGVQCLYVRYNSGLHISENGELLNKLLTELVLAYPEATKELVLVGHSMGGLVIRSAGYYASQWTINNEQAASAQPLPAPGENAVAAPTEEPEAEEPKSETQQPETPDQAPWLSRLKSVFLLGVPNEGSFLEQNSHFTSVVLRKVNVAPTRFLSDVMNQRSNGIKDLRHAFLVAQDWQHPRADDLLPPRTLVPPLPGVQYHVLVGSLLKTAGSALDHYFGDGLVGGGSGIGRLFGDPALPPDSGIRTRIFTRQSHGGLLSNAEVYAYLREWM